MERKSIKFREAKQDFTDYIDMSFDEIDRLNDEIIKWAKSNGFNASFSYDDDTTYLSFYAEDRGKGLEQYELPPKALELMGKIAKGSDSEVCIQEAEKGGIEIFFCKSPKCIDTEESYTNICDYCDYVKSLL